MHTTGDAMRMINELGYANLGILLDTGHSHIVGESAAEAVQAIGNRLFHVHVDDNNGLRDEHLIPGEGNFDFEGFIDALQNIGYNGYLSAELSWDYTIDPDPAVQLTAQRLHQFLKAR
jgi:protein FrlC